MEIFGLLTDTVLTLIGKSTFYASLTGPLIAWRIR